MQSNQEPSIHRTPSDAADEALWDRVEELIDRAPSVAALRAHRLHLAAARVWRARGLDVPADLREAERHAAMIATAAPVLLERARAAYGGQLLLMKGPEVAASYREPLDRYFHDLDLLADEAPMAQEALIKAGFVELGDPPAYAANSTCVRWPGRGSPWSSRSTAARIVPPDCPP